ncbi:MAG: antibiotic biosynthesis monooxygenase [Haliscomenobacter sp.]|nr:antibiotic biosynthesis monooxygenase [Haliscomenobacter sp.]MBK7474632.1 antibiotic biosynthesis monooxygenase [Haliscomenobacter sp.]MBK8877722.1 antibiotic biosynthesis monooxygenase [Haliscomenobacter sp.]
MLSRVLGGNYYAVIFTSKKTALDQGYSEMASLMAAKASAHPGYLGHESWRNDQGYGVTISYWKTLEDISDWKKDLEHLEAQRFGKNQWYEQYFMRICRVEYDYTHSQKP